MNNNNGTWFERNTDTAILKAELARMGACMVEIKGQISLLDADTKLTKRNQASSLRSKKHNNVYGY